MTSSLSYLGAEDKASEFFPFFSKMRIKLCNQFDLFTSFVLYNFLYSTIFFPFHLRFVYICNRPRQIALQLLQQVSTVFFLQLIYDIVVTGCFRQSTLQLLLQVKRPKIFQDNEILMPRER